MPGRSQLTVCPNIDILVRCFRREESFTIADQSEIGIVIADAPRDYSLRTDSPPADRLHGSPAPEQGGFFDWRARESKGIADAWQSLASHTKLATRGDQPKLLGPAQRVSTAYG